MASLKEKISGITHTSNRSVGMVELGVRGGVRMAQTMAALYPRALKWLLQRRKPTPAEVRELFETLGATYIKFGQFIASSPSLFPKEYVDEFQACLDQTIQIPFSRIEQIIEAELGKPLHEVFSHVEEEALASASIAQVHAATLVGGEDVVIKVQKPGVQSVITTDLNSFYLLTRLFERLMPNLDADAVAGIVSEMYQSMIDECDFGKEARNLVLFDEFLKRTGNDSVRVPKPFLQVSTQRVLVMERFYGVSLTDENYIKENRENCSEALFAALNTWFASLQGCEFFHADLHSGNMMLLQDNSVGFIDFGMVGHIRAEVWQAVFDFFTAVSASDYNRVARSMVTIGITRDAVDIHQLEEDIKQLFEWIQTQNRPGYDYSDYETEINRLVSELGDIARRYGIRFPRAFTLLLKQFLYFDRYLGLMAPGVDLFGDDRIQTHL